MTKPVTRVVNKKKEPYDVDICRPSKWSNPYTHLPLHRTRARWQVKTRADSIFLYELWVRRNEKLMGDLHELVGKTLGCVCKPKSCHGDVLVKLVGELKEICHLCRGSGFSGRGTGYDDVCSNCGGMLYE